jgi:hypothetical protein
MSEANYCDRCGTLFAGPPHMQVVTSNGELDLGPDCADGLSEWFDADVDADEDGQARPTSTVSADAER